jgi:hypothetical protein
MFLGKSFLTDQTIKGTEKKNWSRRRSRFLILTVLIALFSVTGIAVFSLSTQTASRSEMVSFSCHPPSCSETFTIAVDINLTDGMNRDEALAVAYQAYYNAFEERGQLEIRLAQQDENGTWTIEYCCLVDLSRPGCDTNRLYYGSNNRAGHTITAIFYRFVIDPLEQTVTYGG